MTEKGRVPPNSKESEMMVLGCMLTSINALNVAADILFDSDFYYTEHQIIFTALKSAYVADRPADIHLIAEEMKRQNKLETIGGVSYLTVLAQYAGTSAYIEEYVDLVRQKSILRRMISVAQSVETKALNDPPDALTILDEAQAKFFQITQENQHAPGVPIRDLISGLKAESQVPYLKELQERQQKYKERGPNEIGITGIPTHFIDIDKYLNGFNNSNLMILAARPAMGKSAIALNFAENLCFKNGIPTAIFSLEMSASQMLHRLISSQAEVESEKIITGSLSSSEYQRVVVAVNAMQKQTMIIDDQSGLKITDLRARARRLKEAHNIGFIVIDYLQLLSGSGNNRVQENRQNEISEISRMLKNLARELNIPILCLAQLSRKVEERQGHRPMMSDLRESGCLAGDTLIQDAKTGQLYTIKELAERKTETPIQVFAMDSDLKIGPHAMTKVFYSGKKKVYELKTRSGRSIKASANHPFYKLEGWTRLDQLKRGDRVAIPRNLRTDFPQSTLSKNELIFLGHLLGDGSILPKQPYRYTTGDIENLATVTDISKNLFGITTKTIKQNNCFQVHFSSPTRLARGIYHPITEWFTKLGIDRARSYEKKIPDAVFTSTEEDRCLFLKHLWATDGNISAKKLEKRKPSCAVYYASSSYILSSQVQHLLLTLGIHSSLRKVVSQKGYRTMHQIHIQGKPNQKQFLSKIGCAGEREKNIPLFLSDLEAIQTNTNLDIIPKEIWKSTITEAKDRLGAGWRDVSKAIDTSYCGSTLFKAGISRERMRKLHNYLQDPQLKNLSESDIYWDELVSITELGIEDVYDASVPGVHNFVANDIIVHNSIENDADVVMMLFRRDYYDKHDKPGTAELIIAKNRHGAIGDVQLTFRKEIGQFANFTPINMNDVGKANKDAFADFSPT